MRFGDLARSSLGTRALKPSLAGLQPAHVCATDTLTVERREHPRNGPPGTPGRAPSGQCPGSRAPADCQEYCSHCAHEAWKASAGSAPSLSRTPRQRDSGPVPTGASLVSPNLWGPARAHLLLPLLSSLPTLSCVHKHALVQLYRIGQIENILPTEHNSGRSRMIPFRTPAGTCKCGPPSLFRALSNPARPALRLVRGHSAAIPTPLTAWLCSRGAQMGVEGWGAKRPHGTLWSTLQY